MDWLLGSDPTIGSLSLLVGNLCAFWICRMLARATREMWAQTRLLREQRLREDAARERAAERDASGAAGPEA